MKLVNNTWLYILSFAFILLNALLMVKDIYWLNLLPVFLFIIGLSFLALDKILFAIVFFTPLSFTLENFNFGLSLALPTEPLMIGAMLMFFLKLLYDRNYDYEILKHPITLTILFSIVWNVLTTITSEMPLVSLKFILSRLWFIVSFYFLGILLFKKKSNIDRFFILFLIPLCLTIIYTIIHHSAYYFDHQSAHWVMWPFFKDHTSYGAVLAMIFPILFLYFKDRYSNTKKMLAFIALVIVSVGIVLSYTRAAWLSLVVGLGVYIIYYFKINYKLLFLFSLLGFVLFFTFSSEIIMKLEKNRQDSSNNMTEHVQSISNIKSDASNLERINRWQSAFRMFAERPIVGFGPGTYMFQYAPFQNSNELTIISTNAGTLGNAHSEYIGPLAEQGLIGSLAFILIIVVVFYRGSVLYFRLEDDYLKTVVLLVLIGFTTYVVHGFINNYLDIDKAAVPFWGFIAIITAVDLFHSRETKINESYN